MQVDGLLHLEFGLSVDPRFLGVQEAAYWHHAFTLVPIQGSDFLADIQAQVCSPWCL